MKCRACDTDIEPFMSFGKMPLANGFLTKEEIPSEYFYELAPAVCPQCSLFQLMEQPPPEKMFHANYPYYSGSSQYMQEHFKRFAADVQKRKPNGFVIELGSNDGTLLKHFTDRNHLGIEPATNLAEIAKDKGCVVFNGFFSPSLAKEIVADEGQADVVIAANVICHIPDLKGLAEGVRTLLKPDGLFIFEEPYLPAMLERISFDQIYDEHVFLFSATSVAQVFSRYGLYLFDCEPQWVHGGSMRYFLSPNARIRTTPLAHKHILAESALRRPSEYVVFGGIVEAKKELLQDVVFKAGKEGKRIVGYGATSKSTTVLVYCGFGPSDIEYLSDTTPAKQFKLSPSTHIPVKPHYEFIHEPPDIALLFAWNHKEEILSKEKFFKGQWLNYVPKVELT